MRDYTDNIDREKLVKDLESLVSENETILSDKESIINVSKHALQLLEEYDNVLRCLAMELATGGFNSDGLISPEVAYKKIHCGIDYLVDDAQSFKQYLSEKSLNKID